MGIHSPSLEQDQPVAAIMTPVEAPGYAGTIKLIVGIKADGSLGGIRILAHKETPGLGDKVEESRSDWVHSFKGKSLTNPTPKRWKVKRDGGDFDQFTGATITPRSIVAATKSSLEYFASHKQQLFHPTRSLSEKGKPTVLPVPGQAPATGTGQ